MSQKKFHNSTKVILEKFPEEIPKEILKETPKIPKEIPMEEISMTFLRKFRRQLQR